MRFPKNKTVINLSLIATVTIISTNAIIVYAAGYIPLEPLTTAEKTGVSFSSYVSDLLKIGIGLAGVLAVLMIVLGGIGYISGASNPSARSEAKKKITNAIFGLILASASWLILYTINPNLLKKTLLVKSATTIEQSTSSSNSGVSATSNSYGGSMQSIQNTGEYCVDVNFTTNGSGPTTKQCGFTPIECSKKVSQWKNAGFTIIKNCYL